MARKRNAAEAAAVPEATTVEPQEVSMALAPQPAPMGMVRIRKGQQQRCIWPVHLAGWQQLGWRAVTPSGPAGQAEAPSPDAPASLVDALGSEASTSSDDVVLSWPLEQGPALDDQDDELLG